MNLSGLIDLSQISVQMPDMPEMSLSDMMSGLEVNVSADKPEYDDIGSAVRLCRLCGSKSSG